MQATGPFSDWAKGAPLLKNGQAFSHYQLREKIGKGGMGEVNYSWADDAIVRSASSLALTLSPFAGRGMG